MSLADLAAHNAMSLQGQPARIVLADDPENPVPTTVIVRYGIGEAHSPATLARQQCRVTTYKNFDLQAGDQVQLLDSSDNVTETLQITTPGQIQAALRMHLAVSYAED